VEQRIFTEQEELKTTNKGTNAEDAVFALYGHLIFPEEISSAMLLLLQPSFTAQLEFP